MIGLGVMGRNLLLNMAEHGYAVAGYDTDLEKVQALKTEGQGHDIQGAKSIEELVKLLSVPRTIILLVPAGPPVDAVIQELLRYLQPGDLIIDGGNSHFVDTGRRQKMLSDKRIDFLGVGISGGEYGARHGPSLMPGGTRQAFEKVKPIFEAVAAKVNGEPCVTYLGPGSAGHYVKMVHNGIEYGLIELIAESYDLMKRGLDLNDDQLHNIFAFWNQGELQSYLIEITANIFRQPDEKTGKRLIDVILDQARQKGTGTWTSEDAMELRVPIPTIDIAVSMRDLSDFRPERAAASQCLPGPSALLQVNRKSFLEQLAGALYMGMILTYAQGMSLLRKASTSHQYDLHLDDIARIWRGGCIIRSEFLENVQRAFHNKPDQTNLMMDTHISSELIAHQSDLRAVVCAAAESGIPVSAFMNSLAYFDGYRSGRLPANLIQAQRDYFGSHTYQRVDEEGAFHTVWNEDQ